jgi:hypothetical protein
MRKVGLSTALILTAASTFAHAQEPEYGEATPPAEDAAEEYSKAGTIQAGGSIGASITGDVSTVTASPTVGYFIADHIEVSGKFTFGYTRTEDDDTGFSMSTKTGAFVVEPSYHHPLSDDVLLKGGFGVGVGYDGDNYDFEMIPAVGIDIVTSRASVITPEILVPILIGDSHGDGTGVGTSVGLAFDVGITTTW